MYIHAYMYIYTYIHIATKSQTLNPRQEGRTDLSRASQRSSLGTLTRNSKPQINCINAHY